MRNRRRFRQFVRILEATSAEVDDLKDKRSPDTAVTRVVNADADTLLCTDSVTVTELTNFVFTYENADHTGGTNWGESEWGAANVP